MLLRLFAQRPLPRTEEDIRQLSGESLRREAIRMLREARSDKDYHLVRYALDDAIYRQTGQRPNQRGPRDDNRGQQQGQQGNQQNQHQGNRNNGR